MFQLNECRIGDVWPYYEETSDIVHLFFLVASPQPSGWQIGHCSSSDLKHWTFHGIALTVGRSGAFDDASLATGSVLKHGGRYYMAYTGHGTCDFVRCGKIGIAVSDDLFHWERFVDEPVLSLPDDGSYEMERTGSRPFLHWRDPFLYEEDGLLHLFLCARRAQGEIYTRGCVAHWTGSDFLKWENKGALLTEPFCEEMECPQLYRINDCWYLLFSTHRELIPGQSMPGGTFYQVANSLTGPFRRTRRLEIDFPENYFYAAQLLRRQKHYYAVGTLFSETSGRISDCVEVYPSHEKLYIHQTQTV